MEINGITVIGGGLAGCEAAYQISRLGVKATVYEMKPHRFSPAHTNPDLAELVCSNSLRSTSLENAVGLLKEEMRKLKSLVIRAAEPVELSPQNAYIRRLQHQMAERANLVSRSRGREPYRRVRLYP